VPAILDIRPSGMRCYSRLRPRVDKFRHTPNDFRLRRLAWRIRRRVRWARQLGLLVGEDKLPPLERARATVAKWLWRRAHNIAPNAVPVFVVGVQRSGTNMLLRGLEASPEIEAHNEDDAKAFRRFRLRPDEEIRALVSRSGHAYVLFKPLCDSHRVPELLDGLGTPSAGKAIWIYRGYQGRARSAVATFGSNNLIVLRELAMGGGTNRWQAQGLSRESWDLIRSTDYESLSPEAAAALFWYVRNAMYFEHGLHDRSDVTLVSYDAFVDNPTGTMQAICHFLDFGYTSRLVTHVEKRPHRGRDPLELPSRIRERCEDLQRRLDGAAVDKTSMPE
jgi:hypothetical protein